MKRNHSVFSAMDALRAWGKSQQEAGVQEATWVMFPAYGVSNKAEYDFKLVRGYDNHTAMGEAWEAYANGGGWQRHDEIVEPVMTCDTGRVYNAKAQRMQKPAE